jgi:hypothetical protein
MRLGRKCGTRQTKGKRVDGMVLPLWIDEEGGNGKPHARQTQPKGGTCATFLNHSALAVLRRNDRPGCPWKKSAPPFSCMSPNAFQLQLRSARSAHIPIRISVQSQLQLLSLPVSPFFSVADSFLSQILFLQQLVLSPRLCRQLQSVPDRSLVPVTKGRLSLLPSSLCLGNVPREIELARSPWRSIGLFDQRQRR